MTSTSETKNDKLITVDDLVMRIYRPDGNGPFPVLLMLHGWTGDENSMWVFTPRVPSTALIIAPRGLFATQGGGFSWHLEISKPWPWINDFKPAIDRLFKTISCINFPEGDFSSLHIVGFSQGAALGYAMAIMDPERITSLAVLSGFLPDEASAWLGNGRLRGLPIFVAHGTRDQLVPIERAREGVGLVQEAGAKVIYCEDEVGHKLSAKCFHGLEAFYKEINC